MFTNSNTAYTMEGILCCWGVVSALVVGVVAFINGGTWIIHAEGELPLARIQNRPSTRGYAYGKIIRMFEFASMDMLCKFFTPNTFRFYVRVWVISFGMRDSGMYGYSIISPSGLNGTDMMKI